MCSEGKEEFRATHACRKASQRDRRVYVALSRS